MASRIASDGSSTTPSCHRRLWAWFPPSMFRKHGRSTPAFWSFRLEQKDTELGFENGVLTVKGEKRDERETSEPDKRYHVCERTYGAFQRSFTFPAMIDQAKIAAELKEGVLTIHLPKTAEEKAKTRKIDIAVK